jgi:hypothetical protein
MLTVRDAQLNAFSHPLLDEFEKYALQHLHACFPERCQKTGDDVLRDTIRYGVLRASRHGFTHYRPLCTYLTLMFWLGSGFDEDPAYPWVPSLLDGTYCEDQLAKATLLQSAALKYLDRAEGENNEHLTSALNAILSNDLDSLLPPCEGDFDYYMARRLWLIHPRKCEVIGASSLRRLTEMGAGLAETNGLVSVQGRGFYIGMMFMLGTSFDVDPLFPWARRVLDAGKTMDEAAYVHELHRKSIAYIKALPVE